MPTTADFFTYTLWSGAIALAAILLAILGFFLQWGIRFRLVGAAGFMLVLTFGLFSLSIVPFTREAIPGAVRYSLVYDNGATQAAIAVPSTITESELEATLRQAASDLYSFGRLAIGDNRLTVRARTILHPEAGISKPLYLGEVKRSLQERTDPDMDIVVYSENFPVAPSEG